MAADQFENSEDPRKPSDADRSPDTAPDRSVHGAREATKSELQQTEPRTRQEHASETSPREESSSSDANQADRDSEKAGTREDGFSEAAPDGEEPNEPSELRQRARKQPEASDSTARSGDQRVGTDDPHKHSAEREDSNRAVGLRSEEDGALVPHREDSEPKDSIRPLSREERARHVAEVLNQLHEADEHGLSAEDLHTVDPAKEIWSTERTLLHGSLLDDAYAQAADVPCEYKAIIAGGLSGAGKTTVLSNHPQIDRSQYLTVNPDNIKEEMARRGMIPEVEGLSPMEASDLVHEESSYLARQLALRAQADGKNLIWDITMSDQKKTEKRIDDLREAGYRRIDGIFVEISIETSLRRTEERYWADQDQWRAGKGLGGRLIPPDVILRQKDDQWGSCNRKTFEAIKQTFENWEVRDNSVDGHPARLIEHGHKRE